MGKLALVSIMAANALPFMLGLVPWNSIYMLTATAVWIGGALIFILPSKRGI